MGKVRTKVKRAAGYPEVKHREALKPTCKLRREGEELAPKVPIRVATPVAILLRVKRARKQQTGVLSGLGDGESV